MTQCSDKMGMGEYGWLSEAVHNGAVAVVTSSLLVFINPFIANHC